MGEEGGFRKISVRLITRKRTGMLMGKGNVHFDDSQIMR